MSLFQKIENLFSRRNLLDQMYDEVRVMNKKCLDLFEYSLDALLTARTGVLEPIIERDVSINKKEVEIREKILNYLAMSPHPNLSSALLLTNVVISYERIGDYCKAFAWLGVDYPSDFGNGRAREALGEMIEQIRKQFDNARQSMAEADLAKAEAVIREYERVKTSHAKLIEALNSDEERGNNQAITLAGLGIYLRRIGAHLRNISTAVLSPFPEFGFIPGDQDIGSDRPFHKTA